MAEEVDEFKKYFDVNYENYIIPLRWLFQWLDNLCWKKRREVLKDVDYLLHPIEEFINAAKDENFKTFLDFLAIKPCAENGDCWKMLSGSDSHTVELKANFVDCIGKANLPEDSELFDMDFQNVIIHLKSLKAFLEKTEKDWNDFPRECVKYLDSQTNSTVEKNLSLKKLLLCLGFEPPFQDENWRIYREISLKEKLDLLTRIIHLTVKNDTICRGCDYDFKNILLHLRNSQSCMKSYAEENIEDIRKASKHFSKIRAKEWQGENKEKVAKRMAQLYQRNKDQPKDVAKQKANYSKYYDSHKKEIAVTRASYYQKNKEKYAEKYNEKRRAKLMLTHDPDKFERFKTNFSSVFKKELDDFEKNYVKVYRSNIEKFKMKCDSIDISDVEEKIKTCCMQMKQELIFGEAEVSKTSFIEDVVKLMHKVERNMDSHKNTLCSEVGNTMRKISKDINEKFVCPECLASRFGKCSSCR